MPVARVQLIAQTLNELTVVANIGKNDLTHSDRVDNAYDLSALKAKLGGLFAVHARVDKALLDTLPDADIEIAQKYVHGFLEELQAIQNFPSVAVTEMGRKREELAEKVEYRRKVTSDFWTPRITASRVEQLATELNVALAKLVELAGLPDKVQKATQEALQGVVGATKNEMKNWANAYIAEEMRKVPSEIETRVKNYADARWSDQFKAAATLGDQVLQVQVKFKKFEEDAMQQMNAAVAKAETAAKAPDNILKNANDMLGKIQRIAAEAGVSKYTVIFNESAERHRKSANVWLIGAGGVIALFVAVFVWLLCVDAPAADATLAQLAYKAAPKLIALSVLSTALLVCLRSHRIHRHNEVVNRHRCNALTTFEAFALNAAADKNTRAALLVQATQTIFGPAETGFVAAPPEEKSPTNVIELVNAASGLAKDMGGRGTG